MYKVFVIAALIWICIASYAINRNSYYNGDRLNRIIEILQNIEGKQ